MHKTFVKIVFFISAMYIGVASSSTDRVPSSLHFSQNVEVRQNQSGVSSLGLKKKKRSVA